MKKLISMLVAVVMTAGLSLSSVTSASDNVIKLAWSDYAYWYLYQMAAERGIASDIEEQYGVKFEITKGLYDATLQDFRSGHVDAVTATQADAWVVALKRPLIFLIPADFSNGNDVAFSSECSSMQDCLDKGVTWNYLNNTVSDLLLFACLEPKGVDIRSVKSSDIGESDLVVLHGREKATSVTWKPFVSEVKNVNDLCNSSEFPGLITDGVAVAANMPENHRLALVALHYAAVGALNGPDQETVMAHLAHLAKLDVDGYHDNLDTTFRIDDPEDAVRYVNGAGFEEHLRGTIHDWILTTGITTRELDSVGVQLPNGTVIGNANNVRYTIDDSTLRKYIESK